MKNDQQQGQQRSQSELETIIRQGNFTSQSNANSYLQQHGLSAQMRDDGTAEIFESGSNTRVATVQFQGNSGKESQTISSISY